MNTIAKLTSLGLFLILLITYPAKGAADDFDFYIAPTVDNQLDSWLKVPSELKPTIYIPERIYPNQPFALRLLFRGYALSKVKNAEITYDVQFFDPTGKPTADRGEDLLGWQGAVKSDRYILTNQQLLRIFFDESYPFGAYEVKVIATDRVANKTISRSATIEFAPFERIANFASFDFYMTWVRSYFRQPDLGKAMFGYLQYAEKDPTWLRSNLTLVAFINQLLENNPHLWSELETLFRDHPEEREQIIALIALNNHPSSAITDALDQNQKDYFNNIKNDPIARKEELSPAQQIDRQWGRFFATGTIEPIAKIVSFLGSLAPPEAPEQATTPSDGKLNALGSLVGYGQEIPLATSYYTYLIDHGNLPAAAKLELRLVLGEIEKAMKEAEKQKESPK